MTYICTLFFAILRKSIFLFQKNASTQRHEKTKSKQKHSLPIQMSTIATQRHKAITYTTCKKHKKGLQNQLYSVILQKEYTLSEIKKVRRVTPILGNELATVLIAAICIALLVRVTLYMQRYDFISYKAKIS